MAYPSALATATHLGWCIVHPFQLLQENTQMALEMCWGNSSERKELHLCTRGSQLWWSEPFLLTRWVHCDSGGFWGHGCSLWVFAVWRGHRCLFALCHFSEVLVTAGAFDYWCPDSKTDLGATSKSFFKALHESSLLTFSAIFDLLVIHPAVEDWISLDSLCLQEIMSLTEAKLSPCVGW